MLSFSCPHGRPLAGRGLPQGQPRYPEGGVRGLPGVNGPASLHEDRRRPSGHLLGEGGGDGQAIAHRVLVCVHAWVGACVSGVARILVRWGPVPD